MSHRHCGTSLSLAAFTLLLGCSSDNTFGPGGVNRLGGAGRLSFAVSSSAGPRLGAPAAFAGSAAVSTSSPRCTPTLTAAGGATVITCGTDVLTLQKVSLVLREIELERAGVVTCDAIVGNDDCEEVEMGPMRFDLPLGVTTVAPVLTVNGIPPGMYDELEFEIHRPSATKHPAFVQSNPDLAGVSIRAEGTFSRGGAAATPFVYTSDLDEEEDEDMALMVPPSGSAGVTRRLDIPSWFWVDGGLIDPQTANHDAPNESEVRQNVRGSIDVFQDDNHDGMPDNSGST